MRRILVLTCVISLLMSFEVFAEPTVSILPLGGDEVTNAGYVVTLEKINPGDTLAFNVTKGGSFVDSRSVQATDSFYENRHIFLTQTTSGMHEFVVSVNGNEIYKQEHRISLGTGAMDSLNSGSISAITINPQNILNQSSTVEVSLTGIERYATGDVTISIQGKGVEKVTGTGPIIDKKAVVTVDVIPTDSTIRKLEVTASWGQRGYTKTVDFPFTLSSVPAPSPAPTPAPTPAPAPAPTPTPKPQLPKTGDRLMSIPFISLLSIISMGGLYLVKKRKILKEGQ